MTTGGPPPHPFIVTDVDGTVLALDQAAKDVLPSQAAVGAPVEGLIEGGFALVARAVGSAGAEATGRIRFEHGPPEGVDATAFAHGDVVVVSLARTALQPAHLIRKVSQAFLAPTPDEDALRASLAAICESTSWSVGEVWALRGDELRLVAWSAPDRFAAFCEAGLLLGFPPGRGLPGRALFHKRPVWMRDVQGDPGFVRKPLARRVGLRSGVALPLLDGEDVVAVLCFFLQQTTPRDDDAVEALQAISGEIAAYIARDREALRLRAMTDRYIDLYQDAPVAYFTVGTDRRLRRVNRRACELVGKRESDLVGRPVKELYAPTAAGVGRAASVFERFLEGKEIRGEELEMQDARGQSVWVSLWVRPLRGKEGTVVESLSAAIDVTREREAREALADSEERWSLMVQEVQDYAIVFLDPALSITAWNRGGTRLFGWGEDAILGRPASTLWATEDAWRAATLRDRAVAEDRASTEAWRLRKDGSRFEAHVTLTALRDASGELQGFSEITRDLTERRAYERSLAEAKRALEQKARELARSNRDLEQFAYIASHDLQEPLRMVTSYGELLLTDHRDSLDAQGRKYLDFAIDGAARMRRMIRGLLAYSRVGTRGGAFGPMEAGEALADVLEDLRGQIEETRADVHVEELPTIRADMIQMRQLFLNLVGNALKFHKEGEPPRVKVAARREQDAWVFSVRDEGIGIATDDAERIFLPFHRLHTRAEYPGSGIGLALCQKIVERRGGRIWVESAPGEGSTFLFTVPDALPPGQDAPVEGV